MLNNFIIDEKIMGILLTDRTTGGNIIWATDNYGFDKSEQIKSVELIKPRVEKTKAEKLARTKGKAEVFTPSWVCNDMNNTLDNEIEEGTNWQDYVKLRVLEITCGEAPFLVSRYDTTTGEYMEIGKRIGLIDRKLNAIGKHTKTEQDWYKWVVEAYRATYGYEYQGDNLFLARKNLFLTFVEYYESKFNCLPCDNALLEVANIISWNIWQMDGLKHTIPNTDDGNVVYSKIKDWESGEVLEFRSLLK